LAFGSAAAGAEWNSSFAEVVIEDNAIAPTHVAIKVTGRLEERLVESTLGLSKAWPALAIDYGAFEWDSENRLQKP
jgi:hypothetical protein